MTFQKHVNEDIPPGYAGGFASGNMRYEAIGSLLALHAGDAGLTAGRFGWIDEETGAVNPRGEGRPAGFIARDNHATLENSVAGASQHIPKGYAVSVYEAGDFWLELPEGVSAQRGAKVTVDPATGQVSSDGQETGFIFATGGQAGDLVIITSQKDAR